MKAKLMLLLMLPLVVTGCAHYDFSVRTTDGLKCVLTSVGGPGCREFMFQFDRSAGTLYSYQIMPKNKERVVSMTVIRKYLLGAGFVKQWSVPESVSIFSHPIFPCDDARVAVVGDMFYMLGTGSEDIVKISLETGDRKILNIAPLGLKCRGFIPTGDSSMLIRLSNADAVAVNYALYDCKEEKIVCQHQFEKVFVSPERDRMVAFTQDGGIVCCNNLLETESRAIVLDGISRGQRCGLLACWVDSNTVVFWSDDGKWWRYEMENGCQTKGILSLCAGEHLRFALGDGRFFVAETGIDRIFSPDGFIVYVDSCGFEKRKKISFGMFPKRMLTGECFYAEEL